MKRSLFLALYISSPLVPAVLYFLSVGGGIDEYTLSMILGIYAFILICNQLILASRPAFAMEALGLKGILALHGTAPFVILGIAGVHRFLKMAVGFSAETVQATFGTAAWWTFLLAAFFALLLLAPINHPVAKKLKDLMARSFKLDYKTARLFHNITLAASIAIMIHVLLASSSNFQANPIGTLWMIAWLSLALGMYLGYRLRGRKSPVGLS